MKKSPIIIWIMTFVFKIAFVLVKNVSSSTSHKKLWDSETVKLWFFFKGVDKEFSNKNRPSKFLLLFVQLYTTDFNIKKNYITK